MIFFSMYIPYCNYLAVIKVFMELSNCFLKGRGNLYSLYQCMCTNLTILLTVSGISLKYALVILGINPLF